MRWELEISDYRVTMEPLLMQNFLRFCYLFTAILLVGCDSSEPNVLSLKEMEGVEGEMVIRQLIPQVPAIDPEVPKVYTPVKGEQLSSMTMDFIRRLSDLKLTFVSGEVLTMRDPDKSIVDPRSGLAPIVLQVLSIKKSGDNAWDVIAAWSYKKTFERSKYRLTKTEDRYDLKWVERIEGNFER